MTDEKIETVDVGEVVVGEPEQYDPLTDIQGQNAELVKQLAMRGRHLDPDDQLAVAIQTLIDLLLPQGGPYRHIYEMQRELRLNGVLKGALDQVMKEALQIGDSQVPQGLVAP